ncbi:formyltransferase family protein [Leptospira sp. 96542]|nr:formyltransferase family protein [Leptospira sp. 96542]
MNSSIFCGFGALGHSCLSELLKLNYHISCVLTHKDMNLESVDALAQESKIPFHYADLRKDNQLLQELQSLRCKFLISVNYRYIIPVRLINSVEYPLNIHGSLLPKYRGRAPHIWAIINGESYTGVTCHIMEATVDTGSIYSQVTIPISDSATGNDIVEEFKVKYPLVLNDALNKVNSGYEPRQQNEENATYFGKRIPEMGYIDILKTKNTIIDFVRAQTKPYPGAYFYLPTGEKIVIYKVAEYNSRFSEERLPMGSIRLVKEGYLLVVSDGNLLITEYEII